MIGLHIGLRTVFITSSSSYLSAGMRSMLILLALAGVQQSVVSVPVTGHAHAWISLRVISIAHDV